MKKIISKNIFYLTIFLSICIAIFLTACPSSNNSNNGGGNSGGSLQSISITPSNSIMHLGTQQQYTATGIYSNGSTKNITTSVSWASSATNIATISNSSGSQGVVAAISSGKGFITATFNGISASTNLTVSTGVLQLISITPTNPIAHLGITQQFIATGVYSDGVQDLTITVTWASSKPNIAAIGNVISSAGLATPVNSGSTTITATFSNQSVSTNLTVSSGTLQSISVTSTNSLIHLGTQQQMIVTVLRPMLKYPTARFKKGPL